MCVDAMRNDPVERARLFGVDIDPVTLAQAADQVVTFCSERKCRFVVTPNVDHVILLQDHADFRDVYAAASLVVADGWPIVASSRLFIDPPLPERVSGSDLVPAVFDRASARTPLTTFLLGAMPGVAERAASNIERRWEHVRVVGTYSPPIGFERDAAENARIVERINAVSPDVLVIGVGSPKQELWVLAHRDRLTVGVTLCAGATIDFLAGHKVRAPQWMQRFGIEWLHRMITEPRRLAPRYARNGVQFPPLLVREWRQRRSATAGVAAR
jgi:N-acetylglucosaminyldiphosphoundecaprenol N-acetyl-beta-D-mannosaminyltransferase